MLRSLHFLHLNLNSLFDLYTKNIPYPAGIQRSRIGVFLTSEEVRGDNDMEDEPLFIASLQGEGRSQI